MVWLLPVVLDLPLPPKHTFSYDPELSLSKTLLAAVYHSHLGNP